MATDQVSLFGLKAALVLTDERGEFEVKEPFSHTYTNSPTLNVGRIAEAVEARKAESPNRRPRY